MVDVRGQEPESESIVEVEVKVEVKFEGRGRNWRDAAIGYHKSEGQN